MYQQMTEQVEVWARIQESDSWVRQEVSVPARIAELSLRAQRSLTDLLDPIPTHSARFPLWAEDAIKEGYRIKRLGDGAEFVVKKVVVKSELVIEPHVMAYVTEAEAAIG